MDESMTLVAYKPHLEYLIQRALEDESVPVNEMTFREDKTCVMMDDEGPVGFFSFRFEDDLIRLTHFLVFKNRRSYSSMLALWRYVCAMVMDLAHSKFIVEVPPGREFFEKLIKYRAGTDIKPYAVEENGTAFYFVPAMKGGFEREQNTYLH